jgi:hypothetical protein
MVQTARRQKTLICVKNQQAQATRWSAPFLPLPRTVNGPRICRIWLAVLVLGLMFCSPRPTLAQQTPPSAQVQCESRAGQRSSCPAITVAGVALTKSTGSAACLLGKNWGYDDKGIWVSDGCGGIFTLGDASPTGAGDSARLR